MYNINSDVKIDVEIEIESETELEIETERHVEAEIDLKGILEKERRDTLRIKHFISKAHNQCCCYY